MFKIAFSLLELLIVIAIMVSILGIVLPCVGMVRAAARGVNCLANQRQVMSAIVAYSADWEGITPPIESSNLFISGVERSPYRHWHIALAEEGYLPRDSFSSVSFNMMHGYKFTWSAILKRPNVFSCPSLAPVAGAANSVFGLRWRPMTGESAYLSPLDGATYINQLLPTVPFSMDTAEITGSFPPAKQVCMFNAYTVDSNSYLFAGHRGRVANGYPDGHVVLSSISDLLSAGVTTPVYRP